MTAQASNSGIEVMRVDVEDGYGVSDALDLELTSTRDGGLAPRPARPGEHRSMVIGTRTLQLIVPRAAH